MTSINFPDNPTNGQTFVVGNKTYVYDSTKQVWGVYTTSIAAPSGGGGVTTGKAIAMAIVFGG
jgi:hypothetical protein